MFDNERYITKGVNEGIPFLTTIFLWDMIEEARRKTQLDYLQVFELYVVHDDGKPMQKVIHTQEQPTYKNVKAFPCDKPVRAKIFCIDDETHSTMLLASEY